MFENVFFGLLLTLMAFEVAKYLYSRVKWSLLNPLLVAIIIIVLFLMIFDIPYSTYMKGASYLSTLLVPATAVLAIRIYEQRHILKTYWLPIVVGTTLGAFTSVASTILLAKIFHLDEIIMRSLYAKNVTTAIAIGITERLEGIVPITIFAVIIAGIIGYIGAEFLCKFFRLRHDVAKGIAIGSASHALGTTKALEISQITAAMSSMALAISGLFTLFLLLFF